MAITNVTSDFDRIVMQINNRNFAPVYLLHGEEGYYIDELLKRFEAIIPEMDRDFNLYTFYAPETEPDTIMDACRRYPMMSDYQVVLVKEAQSVSANEIAKLGNYVKHPTASTILVVACRGEVCKSKEFVKVVQANNGVVFESKPLKDNAIGPTISKYIQSKGLNIEAKGLAMLCDFIGNDLSRICNEVDKLVIALPTGSTITPEVIERNIGISKDYNPFELISALAKRDAGKAFTITNYFRSNPKNNPVPVVLSNIWNLFSNLLVLLYTKDKSDAGLSEALGRKGGWVPQDYKIGMRNYNAWQLIEILRAIRDTDTRSKGVNSRMDAYDLLNDLIYRILSARGTIN
jgi:DNA polymerase-3 subunit delta